MKNNAQVRVLIVAWSVVGLIALGMAWATWVVWSAGDEMWVRLAAWAAEEVAAAWR